MQVKTEPFNFKISRIMDFKNHVEITYERTLDKNALLEILLVQVVESGLWFKELNQLEFKT